MPYLVDTVVPSISGNRSRCTPCAIRRCVGVAAGGDLVDLVEEDNAVLFDRFERLLLVSSSLIRRPASSSVNSFIASRTFSLRDCRRFAEVGEHALQLLREVLHPGRGEDFMLGLTAATSISISLSSSWPSRSIFLKRWRAAPSSRGGSGSLKPTLRVAATVRRGRVPRRPPPRGTAPWRWPVRASA